MNTVINKPVKRNAQELGQWGTMKSVVPGGGWVVLNPALRKGGGGPKPGGGIAMVTGKAGGTRPTAGTVCATGILGREKAVVWKICSVSLIVKEHLGRANGNPTEPHVPVRASW